MTVQTLTKQQEIDQAYAQLAAQKSAEKESAWRQADKELQHQQKQSV